MDRKIYGDEPDESFSSFMPAVGDPEFHTDSQANDGSERLEQGGDVSESM